MKGLQSFSLEAKMQVCLIPQSRCLQNPWDIVAPPVLSCQSLCLPKEDEQAAAREDAVQFGSDLLAFWDDIIKTSTSAPSQKRSSSSSSSSSSGDSTSGSCKSSSSSGSKNKKEPKQEEKSKEDANTSGRTQRDMSHGQAFGKHRLVARFHQNTITGYQMHCKSHRGCSKEMAGSVAGSVDKARQALKCWVLYGDAYNSRAEHMAGGVKTLILDALVAGTILPEPELNALADELANADKNFQLTAPLLNVENLSPMERKAGDARSSGLGLRGDVDSETHAAMITMYQQGKLPQTSLTQRQRNRVSSSSSYEVPAELLTAVKNGYLSPNLPAPPGLVWRMRQGAWKLCPRGG